jgi:hypothetical protein
MRVKVSNEGDSPIRLIVDGDPVLGETLEPGAEMVIEGELLEVNDLEHDDSEEEAELDD